MKIIIWRSLCVAYLENFNATERYPLTDYSYAGLCRFSTHREYTQDLRLMWQGHSNRLAIGSGTLAPEAGHVCLQRITKGTECGHYSQ